MKVIGTRYVIRSRPRSPHRALAHGPLETFTQDVVNFEHLNPKHKLVRKDWRNLFISQKYTNKPQSQVIIIQKNQLKTFCILLNLTLEYFVSSRWPEQVETLEGSWNHHHHHHWAAIVSHGWVKASASRLSVSLSWAVLCQMMQPWWHNNYWLTYMNSYYIHIYSVQYYTKRHYSMRMRFFVSVCTCVLR